MQEQTFETNGNNNLHWLGAMNPVTQAPNVQVILCQAPLGVLIPPFPKERATKALHREQHRNKVSHILTPDH